MMSGSPAGTAFGGRGARGELGTAVATRAGADFFPASGFVARFVAGFDGVFAGLFAAFVAAALAGALAGGRGAADFAVFFAAFRSAMGATLPARGRLTNVCSQWPRCTERPRRNCAEVVA
jgi:hypothetical protein